MIYRAHSGMKCEVKNLEEAPQWILKIMGEEVMKTVSKGWELGNVVYILSQTTNDSDILVYALWLICEVHVWHEWAGNPNPEISSGIELHKISVSLDVVGSRAKSELSAITCCTGPSVVFLILKTRAQTLLKDQIFGCKTCLGRDYPR